MRLRAEAKSTFKKNIWKLFNNAVYGKFLQNARRFINATFFCSEKTFIRASNSPLFQSFKIMADNLVLGFSKPKTVHLNRPFLTGFSILELSKYVMYSIFYKQIRQFIPSANIAMSDTDSFLLMLPGSSPEMALEKIYHLMDFSNLDPDHFLFSTERKGHVGYLKEEMKFKNIISEACLIRSKCYSLKLAEREEKEGEREIHTSYNRCKGVQKKRVKALGFEDYRKMIAHPHMPRVHIGSQNTIQAFDHRIYSIQQTKCFFRSFDDKNYLLNCGIHSLPYGHYRINGEKNASKCMQCNF
jgi:hypothetical protein